MICLTRPIVEIDLKIPPAPPGYAFVEFEDSEDADDAIYGRDGYEFDGYKLRVDLAHGRKGWSSNGRHYISHYGLPKRSEYRVLVTGLPPSASWQDLKISSQSLEVMMVTLSSGLSWQSYIEETPSSSDSDTLSTDGLFEQINVTRDASNYLWCMIEVDISPDEEFLNKGQDPILTVMSAGHDLHIINGQLLGTDT